MANENIDNIEKNMANMVIENMTNMTNMANMSNMEKEGLIMRYITMIYEEIREHVFHIAEKMIPDRYFVKLEKITNIKIYQEDFDVNSQKIVNTIFARFEKTFDEELDSYFPKRLHQTLYRLIDEANAGFMGLPSFYEFLKER